jgi:hypothetical protein
MATHSVRAKMPERKIQSKDVEFVVKRRGAMLGTPVCQPRKRRLDSGRRQKPFRIGWKAFDQLMQDNGKKK